MCANARNKSQHVGSLDENKIVEITMDKWHVVRVRRRKIVGCAVQTNATLLDHASMTTKQ